MDGVFGFTQQIDVNNKSSFSAHSRNGMVWLWLVEVFNHFDLAHADLTQTERESNKKGARKSRMSRYTTLSLHFWVNLSADVFG